MIQLARTPTDFSERHLRDDILHHVSRHGPSPVHVLPRRWPVTRHHVRLVVRGLYRDGMVAFVRSPDGGMPLLAVTEAGRAAVVGTPAQEA